MLDPGVWLLPVAAGAARAALAFEQLWPRPLFPLPGTLVAAHEPLVGAWGAGVYFDLEGDLAGSVALLLRRAPRRAAPAAGEGGGESPIPLLLELANIVASQVVSAVADALPGRILLSVPKLVSGSAERELLRRAGSLVHPADALRIELPFAAPAAEPEMLLVLLADLPPRGAL